MYISEEQTDKPTSWLNIATGTTQALYREKIPYVESDCPWQSISRAREIGETGRQGPGEYGGCKSLHKSGPPPKTVFLVPKKVMY